jgi:hypoxanthine-DNA glycosylase
MTETNPFPYFIPSRPSILIVGSFPCFNGSDYGSWFYSGSGKNHFWPLLGDVFNMPAGNKKEQMALCEKHGIALSDIAYKIRRLKGNCSDANLKIMEYNTSGIEKCLRSGVESVYFTGNFVQKQFKRLFPSHGLNSHVLLSPSPAANMHIGGLDDYISLKKNSLVNSAYEYRLLKYRELITNSVSL